MNLEKETFTKGDRIKITMSAKRLPASRIPFLA
jgi:cyanate lyase